MITLVNFQKFGVERYRKNVNKTNKGFIYVLNRLFPSLAPPNSPTTDHHLTLDERKHRYILFI